MEPKTSERMQLVQYVCGTLVILGVLGACVALVMAGKSTEALLTLVSVVVTPALGMLLYGKLQTVERQSNGNVTALMTLLDKKTPDLPAAEAATAVVSTGRTGEGWPS